MGFNNKRGISILESDYPPLPSAGFGLNQVRRYFDLKDVIKSKRTCLRCHRIFVSEGPQNRQCKRCLASKG